MGAKPRADLRDDFKFEERRRDLDDDKRIGLGAIPDD